MRIYTVHERAWSAARDRDAILVRDGFAWGAFLFGPLWALLHGAYGTFVLVLMVEVVLSGALEAWVGDAPTALAIGLIWRVALGLFGNELRRRELARAGYIETDLVAAPDREAAEHRYLTRAAARPA